MAPHIKVLSAVLFVSAVAITPREAMWVFGLDALLLAVVAWRSGLQPRFLLSRATVVLPFVAFALFIPFLAGGEQVTVAGVNLSREGLLAARGILCKATLGIFTSVILTGTTEAQAIIRGLTKLRVPAVITGIASFMLRYLEVITDEVGRMRTAMTARGHNPRWFWQAKPIASSAGALFVRSYERGERVHTAMLARGFTGTMPAVADPSAPRAHWMVAAVLPVVALAAALTARFVL